MKKAGINVDDKIYGKLKLDGFKFFLLKIKTGISRSYTGKHIHPNSNGKQLFQLSKKQNERWIQG